ncbi:MAG: indole-3-glycerol-phosphate synthase [Methanobacteriaceae archaeon]|nr:indole-3-glycerol-phosphate synthase [Methanobacteriaceae archaeon]MDP2836850.1 indole-3-glycerol-phosphate synthase [Methanobacteriaceae archaeon]
MSPEITKKVTIDQILEQRIVDLKKSMAKRPLAEIKKDLKDADDPKNFKKALKSKETFPLICEYKPASPSLGDISFRGLKETLKLYKDGGASAVSILTEEKFFKGNIGYIDQASKLIDIPIMRKDFLMDAYQIFEARAHGASSVLLMSEIYPDISSGIEICRSLGMEPLVECKNSIDVFKAIDADAEIVGINNRSFKDFSIDLKRTKAVAPLIPEDIVLVSESGINNLEDVKTVCGYGVDALLIGTSVMQSDNVVETIQRFIQMSKNSSELYHKSKPKKSRAHTKNRTGDGSFEQFA